MTKKYALTLYDFSTVLPLIRYAAWRWLYIEYIGEICVSYIVLWWFYIHLYNIIIGDPLLRVSFSRKLNDTPWSCGYRLVILSTNSMKIFMKFLILILFENRVINIRRIGTLTRYLALCSFSTPGNYSRILCECMPATKQIFMRSKISENRFWVNSWNLNKS